MCSLLRYPILNLDRYNFWRPLAFFWKNSYPLIQIPWILIMTARLYRKAAMVQVMTCPQDIAWTGVTESRWGDLHSWRLFLIYLRCLIIKKMSFMTHVYTIKEPFYGHGLTLIPAWISNHIHYKMGGGGGGGGGGGDITYPFPNSNGCSR